MLHKSDKFCFFLNYDPTYFRQIKYDPTYFQHIFFNDSTCIIKTKCLLSGRQIPEQLILRTGCSFYYSRNLCLLSLNEERNVNIDSGWGQLDCILDLQSDLGCGRVPKTSSARRHCRPESFCASGKFLRVFTKLHIKCSLNINSTEE